VGEFAVTVQSRSSLTNSDWADSCQVAISSPVKGGGISEDENMALQFELVTPERLVRSEQVYMVTVPGAEGDFGVLEGHSPMMSTLRDGALSIYTTQGSAPETLAISGGFAEVSEKGLTILAEVVA
jgi:F-type H+-transporting ATPase subunit epsilon